MELNSRSSIDVSRLLNVIQRTSTELNVSMGDEVRRQVRLLTNDIVKGSPPGDRGKVERRIERAGTMLFHPLPFPNMIGVGKKSSPGGTLWLYASPRFLVGVDREKYSLDVTTGAIAGTIIKRRFEKPTERKWFDAGKRGKQHIMILRRRVVQPHRLSEGIAIAKSNVGKLKGSWIGAGLSLGLAIDGDSWAAKHANDGHGYGYPEGRNTLVIGSRARGVGGEQSMKAIHGSLKGRAAKAAKDLKNQLTGVYKRAGYAAHQ